MIRTLLSAALVAVFSTGCVTSGGGITLDPVAAMREKERREENEKREAERQAEAQRRAEGRKVEEAKAAERQAQHEAEQERLKQLAATTQDLLIPELGVTVQVPGDVQLKAKKGSNYGEPAFELEGRASGFWLVLASAKDDRYGLNERIRSHRGEHRYGIDLITQNTKGNNWHFEFSTPIYYTDGTRGGTSYGFFTRRDLSRTKVNCFAGGLSNQSRLTNAIKTCDTLKVANK